MNKNEAERAGADAFDAGKPVAPAMNAAFIRAACASGKTIEMLDAYTHGWIIANLAKDAPLPDMPSVKELARIRGN